jgi:hypothetical protein
MAKICVDCGYDPTIYLCNLYQCYHCGKKDICSDCINLFTDEIGADTNANEWKPVCEKCFDTTFIRECNDCHKQCRSEFTTCWRCHKTDICDDCITIQQWDYREELCTECNQAYNKNVEKRERAFQEEHEKNEARHRRNYPHFFTG